MSKVICDVCGTTFPETANQCPICGSAKNGAAQTAAEGGAQAEAGSGYSYVSGGRFSKSNVRKRNKTGEPMQRTAKKDKDGEGSNKGLVIVVIVLLLAIIAVFAYLAISWFGSDKTPDNQNKNPSVQTTTQAQEEEDTTPTRTEPSGIACTDIVLSSTIIEFTDMERSQLLSVNLTPSNTTEKVTFTSLDPAVATVTDGGLVTPVGPGETTITITCGDIQKECRVVCSFDNASTEPEPTTPTEPDPDPAPGTFEMTMNTKYFTHDGIGDVTLVAGKTWRMYSSISVEASKVVWTSDDEAYVTIKDGVVTAVASTEDVAKKYVLVHAEYGGVKYSCRIRVNASGTSGSQTTTPPATEPTTPSTPPATSTVELMNRVDFTLQKVGDSWNVYKNTEISKTVAATDIVWVSEDPNVVTVVDGVVTAVGTGNTYIHAEYNGQRATCKVIVKNNA